MATWRVTYQDESGAELSKDVTATMKRTVPGWLQFIDWFDENGRPSSGRGIWAIEQNLVVTVEQIDSSPSQST